MNKLVDKSLPIRDPGLAAAFLFFLALRIFAHFRFPALSRDGCYYLMLVQRWLESGNFDVLMNTPDFWIPPLPLFMMKLLVGCGFSLEFAGVGLNILLGSLLPLVVFLITNELCTNRKIAWGAMLLCGVNPSMITLSIDPLRDMPYLFFAGCFLWQLCVAARRPHWRPWCLSGCFFALALLSRYEAAEMLLLVFAALAAGAAYKTISWRRAAVFGLLYLAAVSATFLILTLCIQNPGGVIRYYTRYMTWQTGRVAPPPPPESE